MEENKLPKVVQEIIKKISFNVLSEADKKKVPKKIKRDAFLYLDPKEPKKDFAKCKTCIMYTGKENDEMAGCTIHAKDVKIKGEGSCDFYVHGKTVPEQRGKEMGSVTVQESGYVERPVRCNNCRSFDGKDKCLLYQELNKLSFFDLDEKVNGFGCCNANMPKEKK